MESAAAQQRQGWAPPVSVRVDLTPLLGAELGWERGGHPRRDSTLLVKLCRSLADPFQERGEASNPKHQLRCPQGHREPLQDLLPSQPGLPAPRGTALHPGPWTGLRCIRDPCWSEGRGLFPFLVISGADTLLGTQHSTSFCLLPRRACKAASLLLVRQGITAWGG